MIDKLKSLFTTPNQKEVSMTATASQTQTQTQKTKTCNTPYEGVEQLSATSCCEGTGTCANDSQENVRQLAYSLWEKAGSPEGDGVNFWVDAEQLIGRLNSTT